MEGSTGAGWLHYSTLPVDLLLKWVNKPCCTSPHYKNKTYLLWLNSKDRKSEISPVHTPSGSCDPSSWYHQNNNQLDHGLPPGTFAQLDQGSRWLGKELARKCRTNSNLIVIELLFLIPCMTNAKKCCVFLIFRRVYVPTLAHLHGRQWGFSWLVFSPLF